MELFQQSNSFAKVTAALLEAQKKFDPILKDSTNPLYHSKYAQLFDVIQSTQPALIENGLAVIQLPIAREKAAGVVTILAHISGEYIAGEFLPPGVGRGKDNTERFDTQTVCAATTYARRYAYVAILGIAAEDDDGNKASGHDEDERSEKRGRPQSEPQPRSKPTPAPQTPQQASPQSIQNAGPAPPEATESVPNKTESGQLPDSKALVVYYDRAKTLTAELTTAGLKASRGKTVGAKVKAYLLAVTGAKDLPKISIAQWDTVLPLLETMLKTDSVKAIETIEEKMK